MRVVDAADKIIIPNLPLVVGGKVRLIATRTTNDWTPDEESVAIEDDHGLALSLRRSEFTKIGSGHLVEGLHVYKAGRDEFWSHSCGEGYTHKMKFSAATSVILAPNEKGKFKFRGHTYEASNIHFSKMTNKYACTDAGGGSGAWLVVRRW